MAEFKVLESNIRAGKEKSTPGGTRRRVMDQMCFIGVKSSSAKSLSRAIEDTEELELNHLDKWIQLVTTRMKR